MDKARRAEVAGAGITGLTVAAALARNGWSVRVHERNSELREIGAGILMWQNGLRALKRIGAYEEATAGSDFVHSWELRDERNRVLQREWMLPGVSEAYALLRSQLHGALAAAAVRNGVEVVTRSPVTGATPDGTLLLADGARVEADLVIGADGVNSRVREALGLAERIKDLQDGCGRHLIERRPGDPKDAIIERWRGGRRIGIVPCTETLVYVYLCCPASDTKGREQGFDRSTWVDTFPEFREYIERIPDGGRWASFSDVVVSGWSKGKVALIGDASHSMSPNLGQAACVGMSNAVALAEALEIHDDVTVALRAWEASERPITDSTQRYSRFYGWIGTHWPQPLLDVRSGLVWALAHSSKAQARINAAATHVPKVGAAQPA
jgi:2-polyprenyl-6-methoxyphenol hydroxylase-like FAD-dependent oxidoreductase